MILYFKIVGLVSSSYLAIVRVFVMVVEMVFEEKCLAIVKIDCYIAMREDRSLE